MRTRLLLPLLLPLFAAACARSGRAPAVSCSRSVLVVSIDTLRADRVGAYGSKIGATPNLDRLAARGTVFENAFTTAPLTLPARVSREVPTTVGSPTRTSAWVASSGI